MAYPVFCTKLKASFSPTSYHKCKPIIASNSFYLQMQIFSLIQHVNTFYIETRHRKYNKATVLWPKGFSCIKYKALKTYLHNRNIGTARVWLIQSIQACVKTTLLATNGKTRIIPTACRCCNACDISDGAEKHLECMLCRKYF